MEFALVTVICVLGAGGVGWLALSMKRDPILWGLYGLLIWPLALIHLLVLGEPKPAAVTMAGSASSSADEITKLADLHGRGLLTDGEFKVAKAKVLQ